jgi:hypothetical protein
MRHNTIYEEEVDFQEHFFGNFCGLCSRMGLVQTDFQELTKLSYAAWFGFYGPRPNWPHVFE